MKKTYQGIFILVICMFLEFASGTTARAAVPEISYANRDEIQKQIEAFIEEHKEVTPSVSVVVFDDRQDICTVVYGEADREAHIAADEDTVYEWGSISKLLVWVSAMQLVEQGKLDLNADIKNYIPEKYLKKLSYDQPVTMLNLMNHNGGFQDSIGDTDTPELEGLMDLEEGLMKLAPAQVCPPGENVAYSNWGAALGGYVVQCASGMDYADYVHAHIFEPLGMEHTYILPDISDHPWAQEKRRETHSYMSGAMIGKTGLEPLGECRCYIHIYPAGSAGGTIGDMAKFARALVGESKDCPLFEKEDTLDQMRSPSLYYADGKTPRIAHGMFVEQYGTELMGHGGATTGFTTDLKIDPESRTGFVMMTNMQSDRVYSDGLSELLYGSREYAEEDQFEPVDLSGHYEMGGGIFGAGCYRLADFFNNRLHIKGSQGAYTGNLGVDRMRQISGNEALVDSVIGTKLLYVLRKDADGQVTALERGSVDFPKISSAAYAKDVVCLVLLVLSAAGFLILFVYHLIRDRKARSQMDGALKKWELKGCGLMVLMEFDVFLISRMLGMPGEALAVPCMLTLLLPVAGTVIFGKCIRQGKETGGRILPVIEAVLGACLIIAAIYWRFYQFFGI